MTLDGKMFSCSVRLPRWYTGTVDAFFRKSKVAVGRRSMGPSVAEMKSSTSWGRPYVAEEVEASTSWGHPHVAEEVEASTSWGHPYVAEEVEASTSDGSYYTGSSMPEVESSSFGSPSVGSEEECASECDLLELLKILKVNV